MCAVNCCRRPGITQLEKDGIRLNLCERHVRTYELMGYKPIIRPAPNQEGEQG